MEDDKAYDAQDKHDHDNPQFGSKNNYPDKGSDAQNESGKRKGSKNVNYWTRLKQSWKKN